MPPVASDRGGELRATAAEESPTPSRLLPARLHGTVTLAHFLPPETSQNAMAAPVILMIAIGSNEITVVKTAYISTPAVLALTAGCVMGLAMNYFSWRLRELVSATSVTVIGARGGWSGSGLGSGEWIRARVRGRSIGAEPQRSQRGCQVVMSPPTAGLRHLRTVICALGKMVCGS